MLRHSIGEETKCSGVLDYEKATQECQCQLIVKACEADPPKVHGCIEMQPAAHIARL